MKKIILLTDYKGFFGSRWDAVPYNSGFDKKLLSKYFTEAGYEPQFVNMADVKKLENIKGVPVLYTSSEDVGYHYKDFIEDVVYYLELMGANVIPGYKFLRANNNKVFMELLRRELGFEKEDEALKSWSFGTQEEMLTHIDEYTFPIVIKTAKGALSRGVYLAKNKNDLIKKVKKIARSKHIYQDIKDNLRPIKHTAYTTNSLFREKFILQQFVPNLKNDWKVLVFGGSYFVLTRHVKKNDFRASGSHTNYLAGSKSQHPEGFFEFIEKVVSIMDVPHVSLDIVFDGKKFYVIEFQAVYFGTSTINMSDVLFKRNKEGWEQCSIEQSLEYYYVDAVINQLQNA